MVIDLEPIFNNEGMSVSFDYTIDLSKLSHGGVCPLGQPVRIFGCVRNTTGIVSAQAQARFTYEALCDRCAKGVSKEFTLPIIHGIRRPPADEGEDSGDYITPEDMRLDFDAVALEDIVLSLPSKFLCKESCKGLCPVCGCDLNTDQCNCKKPVDPRLEGLLQFLE